MAVSHARRNHDLLKDQVLRALAPHPALQLQSPQPGVEAEEPHVLAQDPPLPRAAGPYQIPIPGP
ncbi:MAG: hypothetical protein OXT09_08670 [Myxococcales bacterium]|nr:hypothetical protein [Myxococcales bacterium]